MNESPDSVKPSPTSRRTNTPIHPAVFVALLLGIFVWLTWEPVRALTPTADEFAHAPAGYAYWNGGSFALYANTPPLAELLVSAPLLVMDPAPAFNALAAKRMAGGWDPWLFGDNFMRLNADRYFDIFTRARTVTVVFGCLGGLIVFFWARHVFTTKGGLLALIVYCLSPTVLAHSAVATTDIAFAAFWMAALFAWSLFLEKPTWPRLASAALACACACVTKFSGPLILGLFAATAAVTWIVCPPPSHALAGISPIRSVRTRRALGALAAAGVPLLMWIVVTALAYGGDDFGATLSDTPQKSAVVRSLGDTFLGEIPLPFPYHYLDGLDSQLSEAESTPSYLLGEWSRTGRWSYYPIALLIKTPIPTLLFLLAPLIFWKFWGEELHRRRRVLVTVMIPAAVYAVLVSGSNLHLGIRYLLPALCLGFVWAGAAMELVGRYGGRLLKTGFVLACVWLAATTLGARPDFLPYFNEFIGGPERGEKIIIDSNIDWGQDLARIPAYLRARNISAPIHLLYFGHVDPALYGIQWEPPPATPPASDESRPLTIVSTNYVHGYLYRITYMQPSRLIPENRYRWLEHYTPVDRIGASLLVYDFGRPSAR